MERTGWFTKEQENFIAEVLDNFFEFDNKLIETLDRPVFQMIVKTADNKLLDRVQPAWKDKIIPVIDAAMAKDYEKVRELVVVTLNTPLGDEIEYLAYDTFGAFIIAAIGKYITKQEKGE